MSNRTENISGTDVAISNSYEVARLRRDFPILDRTVYDKPLVYLDNAATTQKPKQVIDCIVDYYSRQNANVHRGIHTLSQEASDAYENARISIQHYINAGSEKEVIFTTGTTGAINLVSTAMSRGTLTSTDEVIVSEMEHHSNIVPWQLACELTGATLRVIRVDDDGSLNLDHYESLLSDKTRIVCVGHTSNALGTVNPVDKIIALARDAGAWVLIDGAQAVPHARIDVSEMDADFFCFSSHKVYGPTGFGILYGKEEILEGLAPYQGGGDMIETVSFDGTTYNSLPFKFEAGTPNISGAIALARALEYLDEIGVENVQVHEQQLMSYASAELNKIPGMRIIGEGSPKASVVSFLIEDIHPYDTGTILDRMGIAVRTGHHCAMPLMTRYGIPGTVRASFGLYNTREEVDALVQGVQKVRSVFK